MSKVQAARQVCWTYLLLPFAPQLCQLSEEPAKLACERKARQEALRCATGPETGCRTVEKKKLHMRYHMRHNRIINILRKHSTDVILFYEYVRRCRRSDERHKSSIKKKVSARLRSIFFYPFTFHPTCFSRCATSFNRTRLFSCASSIFLLK